MSDAQQVSPIVWTTWNANGPTGESKSHLIRTGDDTQFGPAPRTLCGVTVGEDSSWGGASHDGCKRCRAIAKRDGLEIEKAFGNFDRD